MHSTVSLIDFPNELLFKIISLLEQQDLQTLSSAIRELDPLVNPILYATIEIGLFNDKIQFMRNFKKGVRPNKHQLRHARNLIITTAQPYYPNDKMGPIKQWVIGRGFATLFGRLLKEPLKDFMDIVASLDNVTSVQWSFSSSIYRVKQRRPSGNCLDFSSILKIVASLPSLDTFSLDASLSYPIYELDFLINTQLGLEHLHSLRALSLNGFTGFTYNFWAVIIDPFILVTRNSPALEDLSLDFSGYDSTGGLSLQRFLQSFPTTQPLKLQKLSLRTPVWNLQISEASGIHLKNLTTLELRFPSTRSFQSPPFTTLGGGLWAVLGHYRTRLKHLYAPVTPELVDYLQTYSGIEYLRLYGAADDVLSHRFHDNVLRLHAASLKVLNTSLVASPDGRWAFADHNAHIFANCLKLQELWVSIHGERPIDTTLMLLLHTSNSLPHLCWLSIGPAFSSSMYGSSEAHKSFIQWMISTEKIFHELDITDIINLSEGSISFFTITLGFLKLTASWGVEPVTLHWYSRVVKPKVGTGPRCKFHWIEIEDRQMHSSEQELLRLTWPYINPVISLPGPIIMLQSD
ncbi:hypothetical protein BT96DRAFT_1017955 [Gymnopus androsaceus JB14]|uniref:F-box domain-containing protein n=1 Tax=Gymnopus androsaceus JB14 TaxID=1447944 RepID=A0A6A4HTV7_9AGAR|nr:hypothetical protein BT96DRAFT_1017955 [Gymnopus androsaceus JB14]